MKFRFLFFLLICSTAVSAQEYWDREDFEIGNRGIENSWKDYGFTWQSPSSFNLPDGSFLHLKNNVQKQEIDMLAIIDKSNRNKVQRQIDLGSPLPQLQKEKKFIDITVEARPREQNDIFTNPYYANPFLNNFNYRGFGMRNYTRYPYNY